MTLHLSDIPGTNWPRPRFGYGQHVILLPLSVHPNSLLRARVVDLHIIGMNSAVEYDVRYWHDGESRQCRVMEDELKEISS